MTSPVFTPLQMFYSTSGLPLTDGYLYIGTASQNPQTNPIAVYWDAAGTIPAAQPIRTSGGYPVRNGSPATVFVLATDFSLIVRDKSSKLVFSRLSGNAFSAEWVTYTAAGTGAVATTVQAKLRQTVSAFDFMTAAQIADVQAGTALLDVTAAILAALGSGSKNVYFPAGQYKTTATINRPNTVRMYGDGAGYSTIVAYHNNSIIRTAPASLSGDAYNSMEDMGVKNGATFNSAIGIELQNLNQPSFKRIRIEQGPQIGMRQIFVLNGEFEEISIIDCTDVGLYLRSVGIATGTNRNVFQCMNFNYNARGIVVDLDGGLNNVFNDIAIEASTSYPIEIVDVDQITFNGLYLEGNAQSVWCRGGDFVTFRDCFNVSAIPFIRGAPNFVTTRVQVDRLFDLSAGGVGTNGNYMGQEYGRIHFPVTASASSDPTTLDDYKEGTWTPVDGSGAGLSLTTTACTFTKIGRVVIAQFDITYPVTANGNNAIIGGLPYVAQEASAVALSFCNATTVVRGSTGPSNSYFVLYDSSGTFITNATLSGKVFRGTIVFHAPT